MDTQSTPGQSLAVLAESLYLANLLLLPGLSFVALAWLWWRHHADAPPLAQCHLWQTLSASVWAGILIIFVTGGILLVGGIHSGWSWVILILYFTLCHSTLVLLGMFGLARAMAGKGFHYPLIGTQKCEVC
jgi:hypothetical protein